MKSSTLLLSILLMMLFINIQAQTTYYVSLEGNDTYDGLTEATSWRTISYSTSNASPVTASDTVYIKSGNYGREEIFIDKNYSPNDTRISFIGYQLTPGDLEEFNFIYGDEVDPSVMPLIDSGDRNLGEGINLSNIYSITIKNIQIANSLSGIYVWNSTSIETKHVFENIFIHTIGDSYSTALGMKEADGNTIKNCLIVNATGAGMDLWGDNNLIENCKVYSNESELISGGTYSSMDYYIVLKGDYNTVRNCYIERDGDLEDVGHGMEIKENGEHNLFVDCVAKDIRGGCFSVRWSGVQHNEFRNCRAIGTLDDVTAFLIRDGASYNEFNSCISENCTSAIQFLLSGEDADYCGEHNVFNNCIIKNAEWAFDLNSWYYSGAPVDNNLFVNCIFDTATYLFNCERPNTGNQLINCIITNVDNFLVGDDPANFDYLHCNTYNNGFTMPTGTGDIQANPLFINQVNGDYHLQADSPCIDSGTAINAPNTDFEGTDRPQGMGYDIGAFEYSGATAISELIPQQDKIYPNPAASIITVSNASSNDHYQLISNAGILAREGIITDKQISLVGLPNGIYLVKTYSSNSTLSTNRILKIK